VALRRRLLLERAAWQLRTGAAPSEVAAAAGYGSLAAFSRAFARAYGEPPSAFAASGRPVELEAPNGIHFHPPAGLLLPARASTAPDAFLARVVGRHLARVRELLAAADALDAQALERGPALPTGGHVLTLFLTDHAKRGRSRAFRILRAAGGADEHWHFVFLLITLTEHPKP
jgi:hypothetical protein